MKKILAVLGICLAILAEIFIIYLLIPKEYEYENDTVAINRLIHTIEQNYGKPENYPRDFEYSIVDTNGDLVFKTSDNVNKSLNDAYRNKDTIVDIEEGKVIIQNNLSNIIRENNNKVYLILFATVGIQLIVLIVYYIILYNNILKPFKRMKNFATRVTNGNLDVPLTMDKQNSFGAFTEAFDIMRTEIKRSREQEKKAIESKKELVAKLSHDIKTPVSSIKSSSELGLMIAKDEKSKDFFNSINQKSDQINTLVNNLFNSTLEELEELNINPVDVKSNAIYEFIRKSDYLNKSKSFEIPECSVYADVIRLQQVFDNIFANSYKYAGTEIETKIFKKNDYLVIEIKDFGDTIKDEELPLLTEKFKRGSNTNSIDGVGLGLYISKELVSKMNGELEVKNCKPGFKVIIKLRII